MNLQPAPEFEPLQEPGPNPFTPTSGDTGGTWVPKAQRTATWRLFNRLYKCRVPVFQTRSLDDIEFFGVPVSGDREFDSTMRNENRLYYKTVAQMLLYFKNDVTVGIFDVNDTKTIYDDCRDHMAMWQNTLLKSANVKPSQAVLDQLQLLDKFAQTVYSHAGTLYTTEFTESILLRRFNAVGFGSIGLPASASVPEPVVEKAPEEPYQAPVHESFAEAFAARRSNWRGE